MVGSHGRCPGSTAYALFHLALALWAVAVEAATDCKIVLVASPEDREAFDSVTVGCTGDSVSFVVGTDLDVTEETRGTANITTNSDYYEQTFATIELESGTDVTFSQIELRNNKYSRDRMALIIRNCINCHLENVTVDNIVGGSQRGLTMIYIEDSSITLDGAKFSNLGSSVTSINAVSAYNSDVIIRDVHVFSSKFVSNFDGLVDVTGGSLTASNCSFQDLAFDMYLGSVIRVMQPSRGDVGPSTPPTVQLDNMSFSSLSGLVSPVLDILNTSATISRSTFSSMQTVGTLRAVVLDANGLNATIVDCIFSNISWGSTEDPLSSTEHSVLNVDQQGHLKVVNSRFEAIGGSGTAVKVIGRSSLELSGVNITDVYLRPFVGERRAAIVVAGLSTLNANSCMWRNMDVGSSSSGAALSVEASRTVSLTGCSFININSPNGYVAQFREGDSRLSTVTLTSCTWSNVTAIAAAYMNNMCHPTIFDDLNITSFVGSSYSSSPLQLWDCDGPDSAITIQSSMFRNNSAGSGGVLQLGGCNVKVLHSHFEGNTVAASGGVAYAQAGSGLEFDNCTFLSNRAAVNGGAAYAINRSSMQFKSCFVGANGVIEGDGIGGGVTGVDATLLFFNTTLTQNSVSGKDARGGAVSCITCNMSATDSRFFFNSAGARGGAVHSSSSNIVLDSCTFSTNSATIGGAVASTNTTLKITNSTFSRNTVADGFGGAISSHMGVAIVNQSVFFDNSAETSFGGALHVSDTSLTLQDSIILGNTALYGAGLYVKEVNATVNPNNGLNFTRFPLNDGGGAQQVLSEPDVLRRRSSAVMGSFLVVIIGTTFTQNVCLDDGISSAGGAVSSERQLYVYGSTFIRNSCPMGGAIAVAQSAVGESVFLAYNDFRGNWAAYAGGALALQLYQGVVSYAELHDNVFANNTAIQMGGAIVATPGWAMYLGSNNFSGNGMRGTGLTGGALYAEHCRNLPGEQPTMSNVYMRLNDFSENTASQGGAWYMDSCNVTVVNDRFTKNSVDEDGGAISAKNNKRTTISALELRGVFVDGNIAKQAGGALLVEGQGLQITNSTFSGNQARVSGGAVMLYDASPAAFQALDSEAVLNTLPDEELLRVIIMNSTFKGNQADSGGGAIYSGSSKIVVRESTFINNSAGDAIPNDEWSDSGGAIFATMCFGLFGIENCTFDDNTASGGPGGAVLLVSCSAQLSACNFTNNSAATFGGAVASGDRRGVDSAWYSTPNLVFRQTTFVGNKAISYDGGAVLTRDINASVFVSVFRRNQAGGYGGAVALLNNLGSDVHGVIFEDNSAAQEGGAAYLLSTPIVSIAHSEFRRNSASEAGGAVSIVRCNCTLSSDILFEGNQVSGRGGALRLQSPIDAATNALARNGQCVGSFLVEINQFASPRGREVLGIIEYPAESYNATIVYDGANLGFNTMGAFIRGGVLLPVPIASGPAHLVGSGAKVTLGGNSTIDFAPGSMLAYANWAKFMLECDLNGTRLVNAYDSSYIPLIKGTSVKLAAGSSILALSQEMSTPPGSTLTVDGNMWLVGSVPLTIGGGTPALSIVLAAGSTVQQVDDGKGSTLPIVDWNRFVLWTSNWATILCDAANGDTIGLGSVASASVVGGSILIKHSSASSVLQSAGLIVRMQSGAWQLSNASTLTLSASILMILATPRNGSSMKAAYGSALMVNDWKSYYLYLGSEGTSLRHTTIDDATILLPLTTRVDLAVGSAFSLLPKGEELLPNGVVITIKGASWGFRRNNEALLASKGNLPVSLIAPPGSAIHVADGDVVQVQDWNRYLLLSGFVGSFMYDLTQGIITMLPIATSILLGRSGLATWYDSSAVLYGSADFTVMKSAWVLSNGTNLTVARGRVALTAIPSLGSTIAFSDQTTLTVNSWYPCVLVATRNGTILYDTKSGATKTLAEGAIIRLGTASLLLAHDSFTTVVDSAASCSVHDGSFQGERCGALSSVRSEAYQVLVYPAGGSKVTFTKGVTFDNIGTGRYVAWASTSGNQLYDTVLGVTYRLAEDSVLSLVPGSSLLVHDSATTVLDTEATMTVQEGGWEFADGRSFRLAGNIQALAAVPAALSSISFAAPWTLRATVEDSFTLWAGTSATMLTDMRWQASYTLAEGSVASLAAGSLMFLVDGRKYLLASKLNVTLQGRFWALGNDGGLIDPGNGVSNTSTSQIRLHTPSIRRLDGELGRTCKVDFSTATHQRNPYKYSYADLKALLDGLDDTAFSQESIYPLVAAAAYGYDVSTDTSGFNASLLIPGLPSEEWDLAGRMSSATVTCTASVAPARGSQARGLSAVLMNLTFSGNRADEKAGALCLDGGLGRVLLDGIKLNGNTVANGDGGGLGLFASNRQDSTSLEVVVVSSDFSSNNANRGSGGGISLAASNQLQQVIFMNTTIHGNSAAFGGGLSVSGFVSVKLENSSVSFNVCDPPSLIASALDPNWANGGGIMASSCNELQLNSGTLLRNNTAGKRGGGLSAVSCAVVLMNDTTVETNAAASGGGVYLWNDMPVDTPYSSSGTPTGGSIAIVAKSSIQGNEATGGNSTDGSLEGIGGGFLLQGHTSTLLANSSFEGNIAALQGGSIFVESQCDLDGNSNFLVRKMLETTAFASALSLFNGTVRSLQWPRPKGCWGTVVYLPRFVNNEAVRSGGALFSSHPEAISLVCGNGGGGNDSATDLAIDFSTFNESALAQRVLYAMKMASYQVLDNRIIVQSCYRDEIQRIYNKSIDQLGLSGVQLSTLDLSENRARGYGYLIAIIPSKLQIVNVTWTGNTSNLALSSPGIEGAFPANDNLDLTMHRRRLAALVVEDGHLRSTSMTDSPLFKAAPGWVYDNDTQDYRQIVNYHIMTFSNKPMDMPILLLDALDQVASENTTLRQAQVRARLRGSSNGCRAELLGGIEGVARNGTAVMTAIRLRAPKGENYSVEFHVEDSIFSGTVEPLLINITVPPCSIGEVPRDDGYVCQKCDPRSFSLWQDTQPLVNCSYSDQSVTCLPCPDDAECPGGAVVVPRPGFWHSAANSTFMNACPNTEACRDGDKEAQDALVACQQWWYSRPLGFDYQAYIYSIERVHSLATEWDFAYGNLSDFSVCVLWGLPYNHPASYMKKQCAEGYAGNLCAVCTAVDGKLYASEGDFSCGECFSQTASIAITVLGFLANVATVMVTIFFTFITDYTEDEQLAVGDLLRVLIIHMQFFVIVTRLNIDWPPSVSFITSLLSACTGAVSKVYSPACLLHADATSSDAAEVVQLAALVTPLLCVLCIAALWMIFRFTLFNFETVSTSEPLDMRTVDEYRADRARRAAAKRQNLFRIELEDGAGDEDGYIGPLDGFGDDYDEDLDLCASKLLPPISSAHSCSIRRAGSSKNMGSGADNLTHVSLVIQEDGAAEAEAGRSSVGVGGARGSGDGSVCSGCRTALGPAAAKDNMPSPPAVPLPPLPPAAPPEIPALDIPQRKSESEAAEGLGSSGAAWKQQQQQPQTGANRATACKADAASGTGKSTSAILPASAAFAAEAAGGGYDRGSRPEVSRASSITASGTRTAPSLTAAPPPDAPPSRPRSPVPSPSLRATDSPSAAAILSGTAAITITTATTTAANSTAAATVTTRMVTGSGQETVPTGSRSVHGCITATVTASTAGDTATASTAGTDARAATGHEHATTAATASNGIGATAGSSSARIAATPDPFQARSLRSMCNHVSFGDVVSGPDRDFPGLNSSPVSRSRNHSSRRRKSPDFGGNGNGSASETGSDAARKRLQTPGSSLRIQAVAAAAAAAGAGADTGREDAGEAASGDVLSRARHQVSQSGSSGPAAWPSGARFSSSMGGRFRAVLGISLAPADEIDLDGVDADTGGVGGGRNSAGGNGGRRGGGANSADNDKEGCTSERGTEDLSIDHKGPGHRRHPSKARTWFRSFFTYDEGAEEGEVRWASLATIHRTMAWWRQELLVVMIACFVLYPAWAQATLQIFACYPLDDGSGYYPEYQMAKWGRGYWLINMNQKCYTGDHARIWVPIGITCVAIICIGIPFLTFMVTWTHRTALRTVHVVQTYGFLYRRYDYDTFYWWEAAIQFQTLMLVVVDVFGKVLVVYQQAVLLLLVLILIMWSNMYFQPLQHKLLERMSSLSLAVLSVTVALGLFFVVPENRKDPVTGVVAAAIGGIIIALNLGILIYFIYVMWRQGRETISLKVALARQRMITATSRVHQGLAVMRERVSMGAYQLRSVTSQSVTSLYDKVQLIRKRTSRSLTPPRPKSETP